MIGGYLITSLLLGECRREGRVNLSISRSPGAAVLPAVLVLDRGCLVAVGSSPGEVPQLRGDALSSVGYFTNWHLIFGHQSYFAGPAALAVAAPLVALGRGAILSLLAAALRRRDVAVRAPQAAGRGPRRGARLGRPRLDPVRAGR